MLPQLRAVSRAEICCLRSCQLSMLSYSNETPDQNLLFDFPWISVNSFAYKNSKMYLHCCYRQWLGESMAVDRSWHTFLAIISPIISGWLGTGEMFHAADGGWCMRRQTQKVYKHTTDLNQHKRLRSGLEIFLLDSVQNSASEESRGGTFSPQPHFLFPWYSFPRDEVNNILHTNLSNLL